MSLKFQTLFNLPIVAIMTCLAWGTVAQGQQKSEHGNQPAPDTEYVIETRIFLLPTEKENQGLPQSLQALISKLDCDDVEVLGGANLSVSTTNREDSQTSEVSTNPTAANMNADLSHSNQSALYLRLINDELEGFVKSTVEDANAQCLQAPTIRTHANMKAKIQVGAHMPFVTGVQRLQKDDRVGFQPVITVFFEGLELELELTNTCGSDLDLSGNLRRSEIKAVKLIALNSGRVAVAAGSPEGQPLQIQFPVTEVVNYPIAKTVQLGDAALIVIGERDLEANLKTAGQISELRKIFNKTSNESQHFLEVMSVRVTQVTAERTALRDKVDSLPSGSNGPQTHTIRR